MCINAVVLVNMLVQDESSGLVISSNCALLILYVDIICSTL